jgi:DNA-binding XRE family transcriptional regulator
MKEHINIPFIEQEGKPIFAVIPYEEYLRLLPSREDTIPHEVVGFVVKKDMTHVKAWRTYLGLTQTEVAKRAGISQSALSQMERSDNTPRTATLEKLAKAMGLSMEQLKD